MGLMGLMEVSDDEAEGNRANRIDENQAALAMAARVARRFALKPKHLAADTAYGNAQTLKSLVEHGIGPHIPVWDKSQRKKVEMAFALMKRILKLDRLRLRGLSGARDEIVLLTATAQNLRKPAKYASRPPPTLNPA